MRHYERTKRALYWTAISLIVCEGPPLGQAARRMGVDDERLKGHLAPSGSIRRLSMPRQTLPRPTAPCTNFASDEPNASFVQLRLILDYE
jgi:hypothetical protein